MYSENFAGSGAPATQYRPLVAAYLSIRHTESIFCYQVTSLVFGQMVLLPRNSNTIFEGKMA